VHLPLLLKRIQNILKPTSLIKNQARPVMSLMFLKSLTQKTNNFRETGFPTKNYHDYEYVVKL
jgi:hypothetical protein